MLQIDRDLQSLIPPLSTEERNLLEENLKRDGCREPLVVWGNTLIDGHNRFEICTRLGLPYEIKKMDFGTKADVRIWMRNNQRGRRNLTDAWKIELELGNKEDLLEIGKKTQGQRTDLLSKNDKTSPPAPAPAKHNTQKEIAQAVKMSTGKVAQAEVVRKKSPELWRKAKEGEVTISAAYKEVQKEEKKAEKQEKITQLKARESAPPTGEYDVIVIDPPWPMEKIERDVRPNQVAFDYPVMSEEEISALALPAAKDCHVWIWTTHKFLPMALRCAEAWGLKYVCTFVWHKPGGFQPIGLPQYNCEFALYCRKGAPVFVDTKAFNTAFNAPRGAHSEKPEEFYDLLRRVTAGKRLDMFNRRLIDGFDTWGNESAAVESR